MDEQKQTNNDEEKILSEELDFTKPQFQFNPNETHTWKQQGPYAICKSCGLEHAVYIGIDKILTGIDEAGLPILAQRG